MQIKDFFRPQYKGGDTTTKVHVNKFVATIESLIEVIKMKEKFSRLNYRDIDQQQALAHQNILNKVAEDSCEWVRNTVLVYNGSYVLCNNIITEVLWIRI